MLHAIIALITQSFFYLLGLNFWIGSVAISFYFIGREYAQAEYRLIEGYYGGKRANTPTFAALYNKRAWTRKGMLDWILPTAAVCVVAFYFEPLNF